MTGMISEISLGVVNAFKSIGSAAATQAAEATTEGKLDKIFQSTQKATEWSYSIMNIIYILVAMVIVVAIFTVTLYVYKFFVNRKDPNYKKNDDTFLDD